MNFLLKMNDQRRILCQHYVTSPRSDESVVITTNLIEQTLKWFDH